MQKLKNYLSILLFALAVQSCTVEGLDDDTSFISSIQTAQQNGIIDITNDNSGNVIITPLAEGITKSVVHFGGGTGEASATVSPGGNVTRVYPEGSYTVSIDYYNMAGAMTSQTYPFTITYRVPENITFTISQSGNTVMLSPEADYANGFQVYFGETPNETPVNVLVGGFAEHTYTTGGIYNIRVVALSGGAAKAERSENVTIYNAFSLPVTYEDPLQNYGIGGTFGGVGTQIVDNPLKAGINTSEKAWKYIKSEGAESWSGTWTPLAEPSAVPINMDNGKKIQVMVYATETGKLLNLELEQATTGIENQVLKMPITVANQWQLITFDFGASGIPEGTKFNQLVFRYNDEAAGEGEIIYIDNITQTN